MTTPRISYWLRPNRYAGTCLVCDTHVKPRTGWLQREDVAWQTVCDPCAREHGRSIPILNSEGEVAHGTSVATGTAHALATCTRCGWAVAWLKSTAGKWYMAECYKKHSERYGLDPSGALRVYDFQPHTSERCDLEIERRTRERWALDLHDLGHQIAPQLTEAIAQAQRDGTDPIAAIEQVEADVAAYLESIDDNGGAQR